MERAEAEVKSLGMIGTILCKIRLTELKKKLYIEIGDFIKYRPYRPQDGKYRCGLY